MMIGLGMSLVLLLFAAVGFAGAGATLAHARSRVAEDPRADAGLVGVAFMLAGFGALCTEAATGWIGVPAFGGAVVWTSYVMTSQQIGRFSIETRASAPRAEPSGLLNS